MTRPVCTATVFVVAVPGQHKNATMIVWECMVRKRTVWTNCYVETMMTTLGACLGTGLAILTFALSVTENGVSRGTVSDACRGTGNDGVVNVSPDFSPDFLTSCACI